MWDALVELGRALSRLAYRFTTVTPRAHQIVNSRPGNREARSLRGVFGWSRPFARELLPQRLFDLMAAGEVLERVAGSDHLWRATIRFSTVDGLLLAHSAYPTTSEDAVFLGPDSTRFVAAIGRAATIATRVVDVGSGTGVGGIVLARRGVGVHNVVLADISERALHFARVNAEMAGVKADIVHSDVLNGVEGEVDLIIANPPYLLDDQRRLYRDGSGDYGEALSARIVREGLRRLRSSSRGGTLLLYTGAAMVAGHDVFLAAIDEDLKQANARYTYTELDPDVFSEELSKPAYADVERIAAVFLQAQVAPG